MTPHDAAADTDLTSLLMSRAMTDPELRRASATAPSTRILPDVTVLEVGGQSFIDRGAAAVHPPRHPHAAVARRRSRSAATRSSTGP